MMCLLPPPDTCSDADTLALDAACPCFHVLENHTHTMRRNHRLNGTRFAHIIGLILIHAPPV